ncbi:DUF2460 domain-containing protein [Paraburkholderia caballeronis]|uniref:DUF2460 domain-containing protein n=1 Tax=Paraburkholderia caballeronis TaxID=416943 RepID=UPI0010D390AB|nr:DUF2460 domain-containing protein [Paraburkholderia caballeronis]TDV04692.1 uncharacterized protein (TIGR02217 family) [Paraburkholderia caballeronis]TDV07935.1 uncharacterized protein (TIGR02217 family) [Paraburkholderia caballeronis]TDV18226.1 uncharacterized protein (TIGR02217 family) [Paraburkholderia caballeronis]
MTTPFLETPRFPDDLAVWARGGVSFNTVITGSTSGREQRNVLWQFGRGQWDLQNTFRTADGVADPYSVQQLRNFFRVAKGQAYGFRFRDWTDYQDEGGGILGAPVQSYAQATAPTGHGSGVPQYQMFKEYVAYPLSDYRVINKPLQANVYRNGVLVPNEPATPGTSACQIDTTTGLITFTADAAATVTAWTPGATTSFTVAAVPAGWAVGTVIYVDGVTGDTGGALTGLPHAITGISGNSITVGVNTAGETLTGGTSAKYPQASDVLTWIGTFDTPVRFGTDQFAPQLDIGTGALYGFQTLQVVEIRV